MRKINGKIGFDDRLVMLAAIPVLSFIIPIAFEGCGAVHAQVSYWVHYFITLSMTAIIWMGNRYIMIYSRLKYPLFQEVKRRLIFQSVNMVLFTLAFTNLLGYIAAAIMLHDGNAHFLGDIFVSSNAASLFCTTAIMAIYESIYFMHELRKSVLEGEKLKRESLSAQLQALRTQVNPHFLFNNLNTLSSIIPEDPNQAIDFVQQLAKVYRHILEVKDEQSILLEDELDLVKAYTFLLKTRFGDNLDICINIPQDKLQKKIVPLSLQILMENAIKHNIVSAERPLKIEVNAVNGTLVIRNNLQKKKQFIESTGIGLDNIRNRYKIISDRKMVIAENEIDFIVSIPLIEN